VIRIAIRRRHLEDVRDFPRAVLMEAVHEAIPVEVIDDALTRTGSREERTRALPARLVVLFVIAINLWADESMSDAFGSLVDGLRRCSDLFLGTKRPGKSALSQARARLGVAAVREVYRAVAKPMATEGTEGAFYKGLRLVAIDGSTFDLADTGRNDVVFGRPGSSRKEGGGAFPQAQVVALAECGTHAVFDFVIAPCRKGEPGLAKKLLRSVSAGMLLTWDRNFHSYELHRRARRTNAHILGRIKKNLVLPVLKRLPDGSYLSKLYRSTKDRRHDRDGIVVRIVEYVFDDPSRPGHGEVHRLITSLLDPEKYPALELVTEYHERWEEEITFDEIKVHQRRSDNPLRSRTPKGVVQEIYGLFLAHFAIRRLMHEAALKSGQDPRRLSFVSSLRIVRRWIPALQQAATERLPRLYDHMLAEIARTTIPPRDGRINPRVVKRKMSNFARKRPEHLHPPQPGKPFRESVVLIE